MNPVQQNYGSDQEIPANPLSEIECYFISGLKADGKPFYYNMHKNTGITGGPGPMGSIESRSVRIPIPRSRKALLIHRAGFLIKTIFLAAALYLLKPGLFTDMGLSTKLITSLSLLFTGGLITIIVYKLNKTKSKFFSARKYAQVQRYRKNGYRRGIHPVVSTTPAGLIIWLLRLIL